ncbi:FRG domain-containing protein [Ligilactobacillus aviarius]|uniref:FRG domain-containing protein n=1 Tax=Ligilactobacillus aviarius TaxID=1606 RepID=UPI0024BB508C|nr:FRG domain-containing protein [Ligilactobacillus aviarius]
MFFDKIRTSEDIKKNNEEIINHCFDTVNLNLEIDDVDLPEDEILDQDKYKITKLSIINDSQLEDSQLNEEIGKIVKNINRQLNSGELKKNWNIFYFYKEFIQQLKKLGFNYFRGQTDNWDLLPSFWRYHQYKFELIKNFENIYREIAEELEEIEYYPIKANLNDNASEINMQFTRRDTKLGVLQHYGFPTPLIDITSNPYIAMLFMCDKKDSDSIGKSKRLDLFKINTIEDAEYNIFSSVFLGDKNKRIKAQKGEFFDFSKYEFVTIKNKIPHIVLELNYSTVEYKISSEFFEFIINNVLDVNKGNFNKIERRIKEEKIKIDDKTVESIKEAFENNESRLKFIKKFMKWKKEEDLASFVNCDLNSKLKEFNYTEKLMFPDTYNQLQFIRMKYEKNYPNCNDIF